MFLQQVEEHLASLSLSYQKVIIHFVKKKMFSLCCIILVSLKLPELMFVILPRKALFCTISVSLEVATTLPVFMNIIKLSNTSYWISVQGSLVQLYIEVILFSLLQLSSQWIFYTEELTVSINPLIHIKDSTHFFFQFYSNILFFFQRLYIAVNTHGTFESFSHFILYNVCFLVLKGFPSISFYPY